MYQASKKTEKQKAKAEKDLEELSAVHAKQMKAAEKKSVAAIMIINEEHETANALIAEKVEDLEAKCEVDKCVVYREGA